MPAHSKSGLAVNSPRPVMRPRRPAGPSAFRRGGSFPGREQRTSLKKLGGVPEGTPPLSDFSGRAREIRRHIHPFGRSCRQFCATASQKSFAGLERRRAPRRILPAPAPARVKPPDPPVAPLCPRGRASYRAVKPRYPWMTGPYPHIGPLYPLVKPLYPLVQPRYRWVRGLLPGGNNPIQTEKELLPRGTGSLPMG